MEKKELIDFLHENLKIEVETKRRSQIYGDDYTKVTIKLILDEYQFSECTFDIDQ